MKITRQLIRECFGPDARIWGCGPLGYTVTLPSGASVDIDGDGELSNFEGSEMHLMATAFAAAIGDGSVTVTGPAQHVMLTALAGSALGIEVKAGVNRSLFGSSVPVVPRVTGAHGSASIATPDMLRRAHLIGGVPGQGLRIGEDINTGEILRYPGECGISIIGPPRSGKQLTIATTMLIENEDASWLLADGKLELLAITERRRKSLGPVRKIIPFKQDLPPCLQHHADESDSFNPLYFMNPHSESYVIDNDLLGATLVVPDGDGEKNSFFVELAQGIVSALDMYLVEFRREEATLPRMAEIASTGELFDVGQFVMEYGSIAMKARLAIVGDDSARKMQGGINDVLRTLRKGLKWLCDPTMQRVLQTPKEPWRPGDLKRQRMTIYMGVPSKYEQAARGLMGLFFGWSATDLIGTAPDKYPVKLLADEFHTLGAVDIFKTGFSEGAGRGLALIPITQTSGSLIDVWGREGYRNIQAGTELHIFLPPRDAEQAKEIETLAGTRSILSGSYSQGGRRGETGNISVSEIGMPVLDAHSAAALGPDQMVIHAPGLVKDIIIARRRRYLDYPEIARWCDPNPYAPGAEQEAPKAAPVVPVTASGGSKRCMVERLGRAAKAANF